MRIENKHGIPDTIIRAMIKQNAMYDAGAVDSSVTQLIQPPRITILRKKHFKEMVRDVTEEFWALLGSGVHHLLELGATDDMITEERLYMNIDGWRISGAIDVQQINGNSIDIVDYKVTSTYSIQKDGSAKPEWEEQLNLHTLLVHANKPDMTVRKLSICAILRDWSGATARRDPFYPQAPIQMIPIPVWSNHRQMEYVRDRIGLHRQARFDAEMDNPLPECTKYDRWMKQEKWAVFKTGNKRASKVFAVEADAKEMCEAQALVAKKGEKYHVEYRPGASTRCQYCGVKTWCDQYQTKIMPEEKDTDDDE